MPHSNRISNLLEQLNSEPDDVFLNYALGLEYFSVSNFADAQKQFIKVLKLDADYIPAYYQLAKLFEALSKIQEALEVYKLGLEKAKAKKNNKAINEFGEAIFLLEDV